VAKVVIAIFGCLGAGKDTFCNMVDEKVGGRAKVLSLGFSDGIKDVGLHLVGIPHHVSHGSQADKLGWTRHGKTARAWLQWIGKFARDHVHPEVWGIAAADRIKASDAEVFLVHDARMRNDGIPLLRELMGHAAVFTVFIHRPFPLDEVRASILGHRGALRRVVARIRCWWSGLGMTPQFHETELEPFDLGEEHRALVEAGGAGTFDLYVDNSGDLLDLEVKAQSLADDVVIALSMKKARASA
jgi:hypothetical protein